MNNGIARITRTTLFRLALTSSIFFGAVQLRADVVTDWNQTTVRALNAGGVGLAVNSATRTADETEAALFWVEGSNVTWNRIARTVSARRNVDAVDNGRLFALLNMAGADAIIAGFRAKYTYGFWRPITAIREADTDGNPMTVADSSWLPLAPTPPHPDYPSNHSLYSAAAAHVLARFFHSDRAEFSLTTATAPNNAVRAYHSFSGAADECGSSRVWLGYHFRTAVRDGLREGERIGQWASHRLLPVDGRDED